MVKREELLNALKAVQPGLARKEVIEQSASFIFTKSMVSTYNDEIAVTHPVKGLDGITAAVPGLELYAVISKIKADDIEVKATGSELVITGKKFKASLTVQEEIKLPMDVFETSGFKPVPSDFGNALAFCLFSAGRDSGNPILTCLNIDGASIESCDNFRASTWNLVNNTKAKLLIPAKAVKELGNYNVVEFSVANEGWVHFRTDSGCQFSCRVYEGRYPDLQPLFNVKDKHAIRFPKGMDGILERAAIALTDPNQTDVKVSIKNGTVEVSAISTSIRYKEEARIQSEKDEVQFFINPDFLRQMLRNNSEAEITDDLSKMIFKGESYQHVIALATGG